LFIAPFFFAALFWGCKKDGAIIIHTPEPITIYEDASSCNLPDTCSYLPRCTSQIGLEIEELYPRFSYQKFNPNNSNEIAFFKKCDYTNVCVVIYDLTTKISNTISTAVNSYGAELDWAKDGNIYYNGDNQQVQQYNTTNKTITQLKLKPSDVCPRVNDSIIFTTGGIGQTYYKNNFAGKRLDSIYGPGYYAMDLSTNNLFAYADTGLYGYNIALLSYPNNKKTIVRLTNFNDNLPSDDYITDIKWHPNNEEIFFEKRRGVLYKVNIKTKKVTLIKKSCNWRIFSSFTISPDGKKILMCYNNYRIKNKVPIDYCSLELFNYFSIMDINGCNEKILYKEVN
jgi:hypothetical protein